MFQKTGVGSPEAQQLNQPDEKSAFRLRLLPRLQGTGEDKSRHPQAQQQKEKDFALAVGQLQFGWI